MKGELQNASKIILDRW